MTDDERLAVDGWLKAKVKDAVAKIAGEIREKFGHEIREAILSLDDRPDPNIPMALNRLRRMEGILDKLGR